MKNYINAVLFCFSFVLNFFYCVYWNRTKMSFGFYVRKSCFSYIRYIIFRKNENFPYLSPLQKNNCEIRCKKIIIIFYKSHPLFRKYNKEYSLMFLYKSNEQVNLTKQKSFLSIYHLKYFNKIYANGHFFVLRSWQIPSPDVSANYLNL